MSESDARWPHTGEPKRMLSSFGEMEWFHHHVYMMEYQTLALDALSVERRELVRMTAVYDLAGLGKGASIYAPRNSVTLTPTQREP